MKIVDHRTRDESTTFKKIKLGECFEWIDRSGWGTRDHFCRKIGSNKYERWSLSPNDLYANAAVWEIAPHCTDPVRLVYTRWTVEISYKPFEEVNDG
jgi:hypothetical protein